MIKGKVHKLGEDINTDVIFPGKYTYSISDPAEMAQHALENYDPEFVRKVQRGDVIIAGKNFGCGSSREQAATCLKYAGIEVIIAESFSRIFFRNAINNAILAIVSEEIPPLAHEGESIQVDPQGGKIYLQNRIFIFPKLAPNVYQIITDGGLLEHVKKRIAQQESR
ncbi:3-isopropylmalate dehydratase [bacterium]|nr:3-isopropylmalate dehydratase [bacterium]